MKRVAILGGGESGVGCALLAKKKGIEAFVSDYGTIAEKFKRELIANNIPFEEGGHSFDKVLNSDIIVKSPGISIETSIIRKLIKHGRSYVSEIEFSYGYSNAKIIGITGSNGKTTTSGLVFHLLETAGVSVCLAGNIGRSFARVLAETECDVFVLELSSFQLDDIVEFKPDIALLLNITPDHLDRYDHDFSKYARSKFRISMNQGKEDYFIVNDQDPTISGMLKSYDQGPQIIGISQMNMDRNGLSTDGQDYFDLKTFRLPGAHNRMNALFAIIAAKKMGIPDHSIQDGLESFKNVPHRMEIVDTVNGVMCINDSKATNIDAVYYALQGMEAPIIWIAGGIDKGNDYSLLFDLVSEKVKTLICLGKDNALLVKAFAAKVERIVEVQDMNSAVEAGFSLAETGDVLLLSPACASFDLFTNYEQRGDAFKKAIAAYKRKL